MWLPRLKSEVSCQGVQGQEFGLPNVGLVVQHIKYTKCTPVTRGSCKEPLWDRRDSISRPA